MKMNVEKTEMMKIKATLFSTDYERSKTAGGCGIL